MKCDKCGFDNNEKSQYCVSCGQPRPQNSTGRGDKNIVFFVIIGVLLAVIIFLLVFLFTKKSDDADKSINVPATASLNGLKFVVTGDLERFPDRNDFKSFIEACGGKLVGLVSSKTNYLITNDPDSGTVKNQKAKELGVKVISEDEFFKMLEESK